MRRHLKIKAIFHSAIMRCYLTQDWADSVPDFLPIYISDIGSFFCGACNDILPHTLELRIGQRLPFTIGNHIDLGKYLPVALLLSAVV